MSVLLEKRSSYLLTYLPACGTAFASPLALPSIIAAMHVRIVVALAAASSLVHCECCLFNFASLHFPGTISFTTEAVTDIWFYS